jgi:hypothetical protein
MCPDQCLFETKDSARDLDNYIPTIIFEVAYTQSSRDLAETAAQHICLTLGQVLLVIAIDIIRTKVEPKKIISVTWSHWEEDIKARRPIIPNVDSGDDNIVRAEREDGDIDEEHVLPPSTAFSATIFDGRKRFNVRAAEMERWQVRPKFFAAYRLRTDNP